MPLPKPDELLGEEGSKLPSPNELLKKKDTTQGSKSTSISLPSGGLTDLNSLASGNRQNTPTPLTTKGKSTYVAPKPTVNKGLQQAISAYDEAQGQGASARIQEQASVVPQGEITVPQTDFERAKSSLSNTAKNVATSLKGVVPRIDLVSTTLVEKAIGRENAKSLTKFLNYNPLTGTDDLGRDFDTIQQDALTKLTELSQESLPTEDILGNVTNFNPVRLASGIVSAVGDLASTAIPAIATGGVALGTEMLGQSYFDYNEAKAKRLGKDINQLYKDGEDDFITPTVFGGIAIGLESAGLKGVRQAMTRELSGGLAKRASAIAFDWNKEGATEWVQTGLERANLALAEGKSGEEATEDALRAMFSAEGLEVYLKGVAASGAASGIGRIGRTLLPKKEVAQSDKLTEENKAIISDITNANIPATAKEALIDKYADNVEKLSQIQNKEAEVVSGLTDEALTNAEAITNQIEQTEQAIESASEVGKPILQEQIKELEKQLEQTIKEGGQDAVQIESTTEIPEQSEAGSSGEEYQDLNAYQRQRYEEKLREKAALTQSANENAYGAFNDLATLGTSLLAPKKSA